MKRGGLFLSLAALLAPVWAFAAGAPPAVGSPASVPVAAAKASTAAALGAGAIYTADKLRDPFAKTAAGSAQQSAKPFNLSDFNIHNLSLRGIMKDSGMAYALFTDNNFGASFVLRGDKLYYEKNKPVRGVTGYINPKQKTAHLMSPDGDVQTYRLGEEIKE